MDIYDKLIGTAAVAAPGIPYSTRVLDVSRSKRPPERMVAPKDVSPYALPPSEEYEIARWRNMQGVDYELAKYKHNGKTMYFHPETWKALQKARADILEKHKVDILDHVKSHSRSIKQQTAMRDAWLAGNTAGLKARPAKPGNSKHHYGAAIDIDDRVSSRIIEDMAKHGFAWGGKFKDNYDPVHYEYVPIDDYVNSIKGARPEKAKPPTLALPIASASTGVNRQKDYVGSLQPPPKRSMPTLTHVLQQFSIGRK